MILELLKNDYSVYKYDTGYIVNENMLTDDFISITKTIDEISIIAKENKLRGFLAVESGWNVIKINCILDFGLMGILSKISTLLANANISIFVISTFNTDYIMVKKDKVKNAIEILLKNGYEMK